MKQKYIEPKEDGLPIRKFGSWAAEKLFYLERYINIFETAMRTKWKTRHYIDLFAGVGKLQIQRTNEIYLGSPILALKTRYPFTDYIFIDYKENNTQILKQRCSASHLVNKISFITGDSNQKVNDVVQQIRAKGSSLNLAFLDPDGLELEWRTVETLAKVEKMDLIIHFSLMGLNRTLPNMYQTDYENRVDRFFGTREWRNIYQRHGGNLAIIRPKLIELYRHRLQTIGYKEIRQSDEFDPIMRTSTNAALYMLLFASKHPLGKKFWQEVTRKDNYGQQRLF